MVVWPSGVESGDPDNKRLVIIGSQLETTNACAEHLRPRHLAKEMTGLSKFPIDDSGMSEGPLQLVTSDQGHGAHEGTCTADQLAPPSLVR